MVFEFLSAEQFSDWGAWFHLLTLLLVVLDGLIPMIPGELLVITSGVLVRAGALTWGWSLFIAWAGVIAGDVLVYWLFRYRLTSLIIRTRWGTRIHAGVNKALAKAGPAPGFAVLLALRFISGGRTASMAAAGMTNMPVSRFLTLSLSGAGLWTIYMVGLGWLTGGIDRAPLWLSALIGLGIGALFGVVVAGVLWVRRVWLARIPEKTRHH